MADYLMDSLSALGIRAAEDDAAAGIGGNTGNLFARISASAGSEGAGSSADRQRMQRGEEHEAILLCAHMDTVSPGLGKRAVFHEDGRITSDGRTVLGADDAAAVAEILEAVRSVLEEGLPHREVELLFTAAEEAYTRGSSCFDFAQCRAQVAFCFDVSGGEGTVSLTEPTLLEFEAAVTGRAAHAGFEPEKGISAIRAAAGAVACLPSGRIDQQTSFNIGQIRGGTGTNIVPENAVVSGEIRSLSDATARALFHETQAAFEAEAAAAGAVCRVECRPRLRAYRLDDADPALVMYRQAAAKLGVTVRPVLNFGGSDANSIRRSGIACITAACGMHNPHSCEEYTTAGELMTAAGIIRELILA